MHFYQFKTAINWSSNAAADVNVGLSGFGRVAGRTLVLSVEMTATVIIMNRQAAVV